MSLVQLSFDHRLPSMKRVRIAHETGGRKTARLATKPGDFTHQDEAVVPEYDIASDGKYCARCQGLDLEKLFDDSPLSTTSDGFFEPKRIMRIGRLEADDENSSCPLCRFFASSRLDCVPFKNDDSYYLWKLSWNHKITKYVRASADNFRPRYVLAVASSSNHVEQFALSEDHDKHNGFLAPLELAHHRHVLSRRRLDYVDFSLVRSWISDCNDHHNCCSPLVSFEAVAVPMQVMDCSTAELYTVLPDTKYAALSYVWGNEITQSKSEGSTSSLYNLPSLIQDAMAATKSLGLQYLWVDRYCIPESDPVLRHEQIKQMDLIYGRAEITLIGLADDPTFRLPGVSIRRTRNQPSVTVGGREILSTMRPPGIHIRKSKWWTRAWTFQEAVLSRRRLYFTPDQVYFECRLMHHCETIVSWHVQREIVSGAHGPWGPMITALDLNLCLANLQDLLTGYFGRDMTYKSDLINAFSGIMRLFERHSRIQQYFGLPFVAQHKSFVDSLLWTAQFPTRQPEFPSWSWTGWHGKNLKWQPCWGDYVLRTITAQVWIERHDRSLQRLEHFLKDGSFDLSQSSLNPYIWIYAPTAVLKFVSPMGDLVSSPTECNQDWFSTAPVITWGSSSEDERCYLEMEKDRFPELPELEAFRLFMVVQIGKTSSSSMLLIVGDRDGKKGRVGVVRLINERQIYPGANWRLRKQYSLSEHTKLGSGDQVIWIEQWMHLG